MPRTKTRTKTHTYPKTSKAAKVTQKLLKVPTAPEARRTMRLLESLAAKQPTGRKIPIVRVKLTARSKGPEKTSLPKLPWPLELNRAAVAQALPRKAEEIAAFKSELKARVRAWPEAKQKTGAVAFALAVAPRQRTGILGVGFGAKISDGNVVLAECVRVYVARKLPLGKLGTGMPRIPSEINGLPTDVIEAPSIRAQAQCGESVGHHAISAGTLGCLVTRDGRQFILSNNHVLANCNAGQPGDDIYQPGPYDGGVAPPIAKLADFVPLDFSGAANQVDAAIAELVVQGSVSPTIKMIGAVGGVAVTPVAGLPVKKCGRTTNLTSGHIEGISEDVPIEYEGFGTAYFEDQVAIRGANTLFSAGGDSGSLVVTAEGNLPVALHFAGDVSKGLSFAASITGVLGRLGVTVL